MKLAVLLATVSLAGTPAALAGSIYKCETDEGVVFSQTACAPDAIKLKSGRSPSSQPANNGQEHNNDQPQPAAEGGNAEVFREIGAETADVVIARVGPPAARYIHDGTEHWLYPNYTKTDDGVAVCPELLLEDGRAFQITWHPQDVMQKSAKVARALEGWTEPTTTKQKKFTLVDTDVRGDGKSKIVSKFGQPDRKKIFNGQEIWEYEKVQFAQGNSDTLTIYLTFEGDTVVESAGN